MYTPLLVEKAELFRALGEPVRVRLLELLGERDHEISELIAEFAMEPSELNAHLHVLRHQHLVDVVRTGEQVVYTLHAASIPALFAQARHILAERSADEA